MIKGYHIWLSILLLVVPMTITVKEAQSQEKPVLTYANLTVPGLKLLAKGDDPQAMYILATKYYSGQNVKKDLGQAADWAEKAASLGHPEAQFLTAIIYSEGKGRPKDPQKAFQWVKKSAKQGYLEALNSLGLAYYNGLGVEINKKLAFYWFTEAAERGHHTSRQLLAKYFKDQDFEPTASPKP